MLDRDAILKADDLAREEVLVPEWGGAVYVRTMTGAQRDAFEQACLDARRGDRMDIKGMKVRLLIMTLCNGDGSWLFTEDDTEALGAKSAAAIDRLFQVAMRLNGLTEESLDEIAGN